MECIELDDSPNYSTEENTIEHNLAPTDTKSLIQPSQELEDDDSNSFDNAIYMGNVNSHSIESKDVISMDTNAYLSEGDISQEPVESVDDDVSNENIIYTATSENGDFTISMENDDESANSIEHDNENSNSLEKDVYGMSGQNDSNSSYAKDSAELISAESDTQFGSDVVQTKDFEEISQNNSPSTESNKRPPEDDNDSKELEPSTKKKATELDLLWDNINNNPSDFQAWTNLLQHVERLKVLESGREAYEKFFANYPYCYGYWKKYVDLEKKKGTEESILEVFSKGLHAVSLSVDLWLYYLEYVVSKYSPAEDFVREQFERAVDTCGLEFKSDRLWELYISWESEAERLSRVASVYDRVISIPLSKYSQHWEKYQELIKKSNPKVLLESEKYAELRKSVLSTNPEIEDSTPPEDAPPGEESFNLDISEKECTEEEVKLMVEELLKQKQKIHSQTAAATRDRWAFEDAIKRPYFHVKPLEKCQLNAWRGYLDFEQKNTDSKRIKVLYGRCLIATALYEEFWMKYIRFLEDDGASDDEIRLVYSQACLIHLKDKFKPHLCWAAFEEGIGNNEGALAILKSIQMSHPDCLEPFMMSAAIERKRGELDAAEQIYIDCISRFKADEKKKGLFCNVVLKYARFLTYFKGDTEEAMNIINEAFESNGTNLNLLIALADIAMACRPPSTSVAAEAFRRGIESSAKSEERLAFAYRYLHFAIEFDSKSGRINEAFRMIEQIQREIQSTQTDSTSAETSAKSTDVSSQSSSNSKPTKTPLIANPPNIHGSSMGSVMQSDKSATLANSSVPVNGSLPSSGMIPSNYHQGYGSYSQYPSTGYGNANQYNQSWGYPSSGHQGAPPSSYATGYNQQQAWASYSNYYSGQR